MAMNDGGENCDGFSDEVNRALDADEKRVEDAVAALGEHFDTVTIFVTRHETGTLDGTLYLHKGGGNAFARMGVIRDYVIREDERLRQKMRPA